MEEQHRQATLELSKSKHLSNESYRKWNISAYKYNSSKHRYEFDEKLGRSADVPKYINDSQKLEIIIRSKKDYSYIEKCEITITENSEIKWNNIITLFETFVGGVSYE